MAKNSNGFEGHADTKDQTPHHHAAWNQALQSALENASDDMSPGDERTFSVSMTVRVVKTNPGWIDRYTVTLTPQ
jgi:hypothetical protein